MTKNHLKILLFITLDIKVHIGQNLCISRFIELTKIKINKKILKNYDDL